MDFIENTEFEVGNYLFFKGGVDLKIGDKTKRVPHRVKAIYDKLYAAEQRSEISEADADVILFMVKELATNAIKKPRLG